MRTLTSRAFNQDTAAAKRAANDGPVTITDRGEPAYVLMSFGEYNRLKSRGISLAEALADNSPEADFEYDFGAERSADFGFRTVDFD